MLSLLILTDEREVYFGAEKELENYFVRNFHTFNSLSSDRSTMEAKTSELRGIVASDKGHIIYIYWLMVIYIVWKMWWTVEQGISQCCRLEAK